MAQGTSLVSDSFLRQLALFLAARRLFPDHDLQGVVFVATTAPVVLLCGIAGEESERRSKSWLLRRVKEADVLIAVGFAVALSADSWALLLGALALLGAKSAFFNPVKYGAIPELVRREELGRANGLVAMSTFLAITLGQAAAGPALDLGADQLAWPASGCILLGITGWLAARRVRTLPALEAGGRRRRHPLRRLFGQIRRDRTLRSLTLLAAVFWLNVGILQQCVTALGGPVYLNLRHDQTHLLSWLLVSLAISIMLGSLVCGRLLSRTNPERLATLGGFMIASCQATLPLVAQGAGSAGYLWLHGVLAVLGFFGAFVLVPVQTLLQARPAPGERGRVWAASSFINAWSLTASGVLYQTAESVGGPALHLLAGFGVVLALVTWRTRAAAFAPPDLI